MYFQNIKIPFIILSFECDFKIGQCGFQGEPKRDLFYFYRPSSKDW